MNPERFPEGEEITCPACGECRAFTLHENGVCPAVHCQDCGHKVGVTVLEPVGDTASRPQGEIRYVVKQVDHRQYLGA